MRRPDCAARPHGFTLVELIIAMTVTLVIVGLVTQTIVSLDRDHAVRNKVALLQGSARDALALVEQELRHAALGASSGIVWTDSGGRVSRPAVQIFTAVQGGGTCALTDVKPDTDAILVVEGVPGSQARTVTVGTLTTSVGAFDVTDASAFSIGDGVLLGDYGDASWGTVHVVTDSGTTHRLTLADTSANVLPGKTVPQLGPGALVRRAQARLFYIDTADELVRLTLTVPRAPAAAEVTAREVLGRGFENMQIDCQLDDGAGGLAACSGAAPVLASTDPITTEAQVTFGAFTGGGPRISTTNVGLVRAITVNVVVRSTGLVSGASGELRAVNGDPPVALTGASGAPVTLGPGSASGAPPSGTYARRAYRMVAAVRNTSFWSF